MARGLNKCTFIGNLGKDPESRTFPDGGSVTNASIGINEEWKDREGNQQSRTEWVNLVFRNRLGEIAAQCLRKGSKVYIEGSMRTRKWQDKEGQDRYTTEINVREMMMLDGKSAPASGGQGQSAPSANPSQSGGFDGPEDDLDSIPF